MLQKGSDVAHVYRLSEGRHPLWGMKIAITALSDILLQLAI